MDENISFSNFSTDEVYELATDIASEFENVVDRCGVEALSPVVLKVIAALEYLERTVINLESMKKDVIELRNQNQQLLSKSKVSKIERMKLEQDIEELQEATDQEINNLKAIILKLQDDNKRLQECSEEQKNMQSKGIPPTSEECLIKTLKSVVSSLTIKLEDKNSELQEMAQNIMKLQSSVEELKSANKSLCSKICETEKKMHNFYKDESDMKQQISEQKATLKIMEKSLNQATQQKLDLEESMYSSHSNLSSLTDEETEVAPSVLVFKDIKQVEKEKESLLHRICILEKELSFARSETESFQRQYLQLKSIQTERSLSRPYSIRQLFRFVLGVISPISGNFRCF